MKALITSQFFCSYFYHSAIGNWEKLTQTEEVPENFYYGISAVILFQCTLESYINFMIHSNNVDSARVPGKSKDLIDLSVKDKWLEFPRVVSGKTYDEHDQPFLDFTKLVDLRNKLVHFSTERMDIEIQLPKDGMTVGELRQFLNQPGALSRHILMDILPIAIASRHTTTEMIHQLHKILNSSPPAFLKGDQSIIAMKILE